jgi:hypothetical protein
MAEDVYMWMMIAKLEYLPPLTEAGEIAVMMATHGPEVLRTKDPWGRQVGRSGVVPPTVLPRSRELLEFQAIGWCVHAKLRTRCQICSFGGPRRDPGLLITNEGVSVESRSTFLYMQPKAVGFTVGDSTVRRLV